MNPERLRQIEELYHAVRESPVEARAALLQKTDPELRREVESLLERDGIAGLMDRPAVEGLLSGPKTTGLAPGTQCGPYRIEGLLGEGGMGSVYRALDTRLHRHVAIKVSTECFSDRFEREARAAAALNHPHICMLHDVGPDYLVMELVPGQTLEDLLASRRLRLPETLKYASQIADAVSAAHAVGIVHRDLKPANVMITDSGSVKVLDFGLAKLTDRPEAAQDDNTRTERSLTGEGTVMGSAAYMSPEQAEGRKVDARSDIFSFGLVLYEMLSGKRAFRAASRMATIAAILHEDPPPLGKTVPGLPKELERIVNRCLRKDLARRSQSIAEIKVALEELQEEMESGASPSIAPVGRKPARWRWCALGGVVAALGAALFFLLSRETRAPLTQVPLTSYNGFLADPALSPDGSQFAFAWDGGQDNALPQLYVSLVGRGTPLQLTTTPGAAARAPAWSPDGQTIAYLRVTPGKKRSDLMVIPALGGPERRIGGAVLSIAMQSFAEWRLPSLGRPAWSPDGKWLYFSDVSPQTTAIFVVPAAGGEARQLTDPSAATYGDWGASVSPDGLKLVFDRKVADLNRSLFVVELRNGNTAGALRQITNDSGNAHSPVWTGDGRDIIYIDGAENSAQSILRVRASGGLPVRIEGISADYATSLSISPARHRLAYGRALEDYNIYKLPLSSAGGPRQKFLSSTRYEGSPAYSPDGRRIAFDSNRSGVHQIWVADADGSNAVALTNFTSGVAGSPKWSPIAPTIVFDARPRGLADIYSINAEGGTPKRLTDNPAEDHIPTYSADGRWIYFSSMRSGKRQIYRMPANGGEATQITRNGAYLSMASPDGKWIYYGQAGRLWRVPPEGGEETPVLEVPSLYNPNMFCVTGLGVYYAGAFDPASRTIPLRLYRFTDGKTVELGRFDKPFGGQPSVSPDGKWLAYSQMDSSVYDLMLVENFR
jgi:Tol biopolymer transport system component/tRNA A-37 threonylcarbamoyl transferase component Bud32